MYFLREYNLLKILRKDHVSRFNFYSHIVYKSFTYFTFHIFSFPL